MDPSKIFVYFGYAMAAVFFGIGIYVLFLFPDDVMIDEKPRRLFGAVLILYSIYRVVSLRIKERHADDDEE